MKGNLKVKVFSALFCLSMLAGFCTAHGATLPQTVHAEYWGGAVMVDGETVMVTDFRDASGKVVPRFSYGGTVYIPLPTAGAWLGKNAAWDASSRTVSLSGTDGELPALVPDTPEEELAWEKMKEEGLDVQLDPGISITMDGKTQKLVNAAGVTVYPAVYQNTVYLPLRSIGALLGKEVAYDALPNNGGSMVFLRTPLSPETQAQLENFLTDALPASHRLAALSNPEADQDGAARLTEIKALLEEINGLIPENCSFASGRFANLKKQTELYRDELAAGLARINAGEAFEAVAQENDGTLLSNANFACLHIPQLVQVIQEGITQKLVITNQTLVSSGDETLQHLAELWLVDGEYPRNSKGETYGPLALEGLLGYVPDLIAAAATNGKEGFVRQEDFMVMPGTVVEIGKSYMIPVYDLEGNVIGEFEMS